MPFDMNRMKKFFGTMLTLALVLTLVITMLLFVVHVAGGGDPIGYLGNQNFIMGITFLILEWVGYLMLKGKFHPPDDMGRRPQQRAPPQRQPQMQQILVPAKIEIEVCPFCSKEKPITEMRPFYDGYGNEILVCEDCIRKENK